LELEKALSENSFDREIDIPGESAPIEEKKLSLFRKNKVEKYNTRRKQPKFDSPKSVKSRMSMLSEKRLKDNDYLSS
jgi:hypothetical protein